MSRYNKVIERLKEGTAMKKVTMADVAKEAGVSKSTVSQFLNKRFEYMGENTKKRIEEAIEKLGYQPNYIARSLKQKRTSMIAIIVANILHYFSTGIIRSIEDFCRHHDLHAIVCNADDHPDQERRYIEVLRAKQVDGMIIFPTGKNRDLYEKMVREGYPVVFVDRKTRLDHAYSVVTDNAAATCQAIKQLIGQGHQRIAFVVQPLMVSTRKGRLEGYRKAMADAGLPVNPKYIVESPVDEVKSRLENLFASKERPTALFAGNDRMFLAVMEFIKEKGLVLGEEMDLVVFDNIPFARFMDHPITFIEQPAAEMGRKAAELLFEQMNGGKPEPGEYVFPSRMVQGNPTAGPALPGANCAVPEKK
jgi:LacI family transcriptional regulator, kdg operon repressor